MAKIAKNSVLRMKSAKYLRNFFLEKGSTRLHDPREIHASGSSQGQVNQRNLAPA